MSSTTPDVPAQFDLVERELLLVRVKWQQFEALFGTEENVNLVNQVASGFFRLVQDMFLDNVILSLTRLLDPPRSTGKDNLTIERLIASLPASVAPTVVAAVTADLEDIRSVAGGLTIIRNKLLAHNSLDEKQSGAATLYSGVTRNLITSVIDRLGALVNRLRQELNELTMLYEVTVYPHGAERLLSKLRRLAELPPRGRKGSQGRQPN